MQRAGERRQQTDESQGEKEGGKIKEGDEGGDRKLKMKTLPHACEGMYNDKHRDPDPLTTASLLYPLLETLLQCSICGTNRGETFARGSIRRFTAFPQCLRTATMCVLTHRSSPP